jgi:N-acetyl-alpha-D-glucosaminyl L-malate synthase BshA
MRIGITCHATVGGSGAIAASLGKLLAGVGHEVHFICHEMPFGLAGDSHPGITVHEVTPTQYPPLRFPPYGMALAVKMASVARLARLDVLHVHYAIPHALSAFLAREMVAPDRLRIVCTLHGTDVTLVGADPSYKPLARFLLEACDVVTAVSSWLAETAITSFELDRDVDTVYNFVDTDKYRRANEEKERTPTIVHVSNFRPIKRTGDVIEIFKRVREQTPARLVMVGDGPDAPEAIERAEALGIASDVSFIGVAEDVIDILSESDVFLLPSEMESFGLAALEAMACETPVVATNVGGLSEVVEDGESGFLLPFGDVNSMADRTLEILQNPELRIRMGKKGRDSATAKFSPETALKAYLNAYDLALE